MVRIVTARQMQEIDRRAASDWHIPGAVLMENAGRSVVDAIEREFPGLVGKRFAVVCGRGSNGGDGFVICRHLGNRGALATCCLLGRVAELSGDTLANARILAAAGVQIQEFSEPSELGQLFSESDMIVDALFGTGLDSAPRGIAADVIKMMNASGRPIVAVDIPSGVNSDTGAVTGAAVRARLTVTMALPKTGLLLYPGRAHTGALTVADIGIPSDLLSEPADTCLADRNYVRARLPARPADGHKGTFGTTLIVAGSRNFSGAACLAGLAAIRSGCGLTRIAFPVGIADVIAGCVLEAVKVPLPQTDSGTLDVAGIEPLVEQANTADAVAIGPGIGTHPNTRRVVNELLPRLIKPVVLDADGINNLAADLSVLGQVRAAVLTPHPGEFARLTGMYANEVNSNRIEVSRAFAQQHRLVLVLKGAPTVVAGPEGKVFVNPTGNSGLASGGTGDILTGLIAGFVAQGMPTLEAAVAGVYLHGHAADVAARHMPEYCITAGDVLRNLPQAFSEVLDSRTS